MWHRHVPVLKITITRIRQSDDQIRRVTHTREIHIHRRARWLLMVHICVTEAVMVGRTVFWQVYGLGMMGECCEGGACIPEVATRCPKCFFFFQAEDGIRDLTVTGVQTCALPI